MRDPGVHLNPIIHWRAGSLIPERLRHLSMDALDTPKLHDVTILTRKTYQCARVEGVPPEEFGIARHARSLRDCGYCFHEVLRREADLIAAGYDPVQIRRLPSTTTIETREGRARDTVEENVTAASDGLNKSNRD